MRSEVPAIQKTGLVLSGGGTRGAYEVGVVSGIMQVLKPKLGDPPVFRIFSGASVGAINTTFLAANAELPDHGVSKLSQLWKSLDLSEHARIRPLGLARLPGSLRSRLKSLAGEKLGTSLLDTRAIDLLVRRSIDWDKLHRVIDSGRVLSLLVAALHVASGRTIMFSEHAPGTTVIPTRDERRATVFERITPSHVLASAAIPLLFPSQRIGKHYYCDGGLRFNTPIAPAIRAGSDRLIIVSVRHSRTARDMAAVEEADTGEGRDLGPAFLIGKLLNALLLDPVAYDLQVLERLNQVMDVLEQSLSQAELDRVQRVWIEHRGLPYRKLKTLVFTPSRDLGEIAGDYLRTRMRTDHLRPLARYLMDRAVQASPHGEADWASYILFDGSFATELIAIGERDALERRDEILEFFGRTGQP
ncbi:MAG TPA: patatin-like phospholipase family protein [Polyangiaceae bacterium]|nr:patatin-like phospholipase family protein [Polyangiaceae bacterium]